MKTRRVLFIMMGLVLLAGCGTASRTADIAVQPGMSRETLRRQFGEPLRIEPGPWGGEDWYYRFVTLNTRPTGATGVTGDKEFGDNKTSYVGVGLKFSKPTEEHPVHLSAEGFVIEPVPRGKVVKN